MASGHQLDLFDAAASEARKRAGMDAAAESGKSALEVAREIAREIATPEGITADDVIHEMVKRGWDIHSLGNAAGSLFRGWTWTGKFRKSTRVHAHSNLLRVWVTK